MLGHLVFVQAAASHPRPALGCLHVDLVVLKPCLADSKSSPVVCHHVSPQLDREPTTSTTSKLPVAYCIFNQLTWENLRKRDSKEELDKNNCVSAAYLAAGSRLRHVGRCSLQVTQTLTCQWQVSMTPDDRRWARSIYRGS